MCEGPRRRGPSRFSCAREDSNLRPHAPEARALSPELRALGKGQSSFHAPAAPVGHDWGVDRELMRETEALYGLPAGEFTKARNARAKELRAEQPELAALLAKLPKPTAAAAAINRVARDDPSEVRALVQAGRAVRPASTARRSSASAARHGGSTSPPPSSSGSPPPSARRPSTRSCSRCSSAACSRRSSSRPASGSIPAWPGPRRRPGRRRRDAAAIRSPTRRGRHGLRSWRPRASSSRRRRPRPARPSGSASAWRRSSRPPSGTWSGRRPRSRKRRRPSGRRATANRARRGGRRAGARDRPA